MAGQAQPQPLSPSKRAVGRDSSLAGLPLLSPPSKTKRRGPLLLGTSGTACLERPVWAPPPLPRCASYGVPKRHEEGQQEALQQRLRLRAEHYEHLDFHGFGGDTEGLRAFLAHKYGGSVRGWRIAIAPDKLGIAPVTFSEFCAGMRRIGYTGHAMSLWKELSKGKASSVGLWDFEPDLAAQLDVLAQGFIDNFKRGTVDGWLIMPRRHALRASFEEFKAFVEDIDERELLPDDAEIDLRRIFEAIGLHSRGSITREDLRFLDHWAHKRLGAELPEEPQQETAAEPERWSPPPAKPKREPDLEDFRLHCERYFGSCARAWRIALDVRGCGALSPADFGKGCRSMGWKHRHQEIWEELCRAGDGQATLRALDPDTAEALVELREAACDAYGDVQGLWFGLLDPGETGAVSRTEFVADVVRELGVSTEVARRVFAALDTARTGWIAASEFGFLADFECAPVEELPSGVSDEALWAEAVLSPTGRLTSSLSSPALGTEATRSSSWSPAKGQIWSPAKSSRATQHRFFAQSHQIKHRWLKEAALERCHYGSRDTLQSTRDRLRGEIRSTAQKDVFRTTNEFYREGIRRIMGSPPSMADDGA